MSDTISPFAARALALLQNGYDIVPVKAGEKAPGVKDWESITATPQLVRKWAANGFANGNIGIRTQHTPAIDLDIYDEPMAREMEAWCIARFGDTPVRVGRAPKRLLMYAVVGDPFKKLQLTFKDPQERKHKVEILGDGQQFVAYGIHPDTKQPFKWTSLEEPLDTEAMLLPGITVEDAQSVLDHFRELALARGWVETGGGSRATTAVTRGDDNALLSYKPALRITKEQLVEALKHVPDADDHDQWIKVGMALHHQFDGDDEGLDLWHEWSMQADNYDTEVLDKRWASFASMPEGHVAVTAATILKIAGDQIKRETDAEFNRVLSVIRTCNSESALFGEVMKAAAEVAITDFQFDVLAKRLQDRAFELAGVRPRIDTVRKSLNAARVKAGSEKDAPWWVKDWVYLQNGDRFYNLVTKNELTERSFNTTYNRELLSPQDRLAGNVQPSINAATLATNSYCIETVYSTIYLPGEQRIVEIGGKKYANTFDESSIPPEREPTTAADRAVIAKAEAHFELLFEDERERNLLLDYLAYTVQLPAEKIVWGIVIQGVEGAGKTWMLHLMAAVLGPENVAPLEASVLQDTFTGWAQGKKLLFVEEIRLSGANRYEVIDKFKPFVSNATINVRRMQRESCPVPNVTNYLLFTNYWDALPLSRTDRRYLVISTSFQTKEEMDEFGAKHPSYFSELFGITDNHGDLLRWWLMSRQLGSDFKPKAPAPDSFSKHKMRDAADAHNDDTDVIEDLINADTDAEITPLVLNLTKLTEALENGAMLPPKTVRLKAVLVRMGYHLLGRFRAHGTKGGNDRYYTKFPRKFKRNSELDAIRAHIEAWQKAHATDNNDDGLGD